MRERKRCLLSRCLAVLLAAVLMFGVVGYAPEAKAASQFETGFYKPLDGLKKTSGFVPYRTAVSNGKTYTSAHLATDYSTTTGQWNVMAVYDGTVYKVNNALNSGAGRYVTLKHEIGGKTVYSLYQHLQKISVSVGQEIKGGQVIAVAGRSGTTENQYDRHLHIILYSGKNAWVTDASAFAGKYEKGAEANGPISYGGTTYYNPARVFSGACVIGDGSYLGQKVIDSTLRTAISIKDASGEDQCYIKKDPFEESSDKSAAVPKGNTIKLVGAVENKYGNIWYKTEDGGFVYSGDIIFYQDYFSISAKFKNTERRSSHKLPFVDSDEVKKIGKDDVVQVSKFVLNSYGNIWAQLTDGSFLCFCDKETGENKLQFSSHVTKPTHSTTYPQGNIKVTSSYGFLLKGDVKAEVPFLSLTARVIDRETEKDVSVTGSPCTLKPAVSTRTINLEKTKIDGKTMDSIVLIRKLNGSSGWYRYELNAQFGFTYNGKTFKFGNEYNLVSSNFSVGKAGQTEPPSLTDPFAKFQTLFTLSAKFKNTEKRNSHKAPYLDSPEVKTIGKDDVVEVTEFVTNSHGNVWAKLTDGSYLCFYDKETGENKLQFSSHVTQPSISEATKPTGDINVTNQGFWLKGTVKSGVPFLTVSTRIIDRETGNDVEGRSPISVSPSASTREVVIYKKDDSNCLDSRTIFNNLPKGWYQYQLNAQFGFTYEGKTFKFGGAHNFITSDFTVGNPGTLETTPTPEPPGGEEEPPSGDVGARVPGDANEDEFVDIFDALLVLQYDAGWDVQINTSNGDVNADGIADIFDALLLLQYDAGWDVVLQ